VSLRLFDSAEAARAAQRGGVRRLLMLQLREEVKYLQRRLPGAERMSLHYATIGKPETLKADLIDAIVDRALYMPEGDECNIRTREQFLARAQHGWRRMNISANELSALVARILEQHHALHLELSKVAPPLLVASYQDMRHHLSSLVYDGFVRRTPPHWLEHYPRFLDALKIRLRKLHSAGLARDLAAMREIEPMEERVKGSDQRSAVSDQPNPELEQYRWMLQERRVSLFAQELKTSIPVSVKRLDAQWEKVTRRQGDEVGGNRRPL
jgi:ATP-dependent helicase HrpA